MIWLSVKQAAALENRSEATIRRNQDHYRTRTDGRLEIALDSLSVQAQSRYWQQAGEIDAEFNLAEVPDWAMKRALDRFNLLQKVFEMDMPRRDAVRQVSRESGKSERTLWRLLTAYREHGFQGLLPDWGSRRGSTLPEELQKLIRSLYLQPTQPMIQHVWEDVSKYCQEKGIEAPSYYAVYRFCRSIPESEKTMHRIGRKAWKQQFEPVVRRTFDDLKVNEIWCGDHREFDVFVLDKQGKPRRPWLTAFMDLRSRVITGWHVSFQPNSQTIALALRHGILRCGKPDELYIDNGKDYRSHYLSGAQKKLGAIDYSKQTRAILAALDIRTIYAWPYNARSKPIERWFLNLALRFERYLPGWCGRDNKQRPEKLQKELQSGELLTIGEFKKRVAEHIEQYHRSTHSSLKAAPLSVFETAEIVTVSERALDLLLMKSKEKRLYNDGIRLFTDVRYISEELLRRVAVGEKVQVLYDPDDIREIVVMKDGKFVCKAPMAAPMSMRASEKDFERAARLRKAARERLRRSNEDWQVATDMQTALQKARETGGDEEKEEARPQKAARVLRLIPKEEMEAEKIEKAKSPQPAPDQEPDMPFFDLPDHPDQDNDEPFLFYAEN